MSSGIANATPGESQGTQVGGLERIGSDSNGSESAAEAFTQFLESEVEGDKPAPRAPKAPRREAPEPKDGAETGEGQPPKRQPRVERQEAQDDDEGDDPLRDPILDGAPKRKGDDAEDEGDDEPDEGEDDAEGEDEGEDDGDDDPEHEVTVRGVPQRVKLSELIQGYHREADYRQKTTALAEDRQVVHQAYQHATGRVQVLDNAIQAYQDLIEAVMPSPQDWEALKASNPQEYIRAQEQWSGFLEKMQQSKGTRDAAAQERQQFEARQRDDFIRSENAKLLERVPALADKAVGKQFSDVILGYGRKMGYTAEQMQEALIDHRDVLTAYYAGKYLELQESRQANRQKAQKARPKASEGNTQRVNTPQTRQGRRASNNRQSLRNADRELQRTGSMQSAASAFAAMMRE